MASLRFTVPGTLDGKQRAGRRTLYSGQVRSFNPHKTERLEKLIRQHAMLEMRGKKMMVGPLSMTVNVKRVYPRSWSKAKRAKVLFITGKPDADNQLKLVGDACNNTVFKDDSQIACIALTRVYGASDEFEIAITELDAIE